jgi:molybdopterin molybdotransferase
MPDEDVDIAEGAGRVLAQDIVAAVTQPPFAASAMDGYAVRFADMTPGARLTVTGESPAGSAFDGEVHPGDAVRIFTGAVVPDGADHVIIQEDVRREGDSIVVVEAQKAPGNIRAAGIDFREGDVVLRRGEVLRGARLALAAAANVARVTVARRPVAAIIASGDELAAPGSVLRPGQIVGSTGYGLAALVRDWGGAPVMLGTATDTIEAVHEKLDDAKGADLIVPLGGASVGDRDVMRAAFEARGFQLYFEKIAVRPGKPTWFGADASGRRVLGLPGNPASALVCAQLFVKPLLWAMTGRDMADAVRTTPARLEDGAPGNGPRETYLRAHAWIAEDGVLSVTHFPRQDSSLLTPFAAANCLLRLAPDAGPAQAGTMGEVLLLGDGL